MIELDLPDTVAFDGGMLAAMIGQLVEHSCLSDRVEATLRDSAVSRNQVLELAAGSLSPQVWSSGEQQLWCFIASLAGVTRVSLAQVMNHFRDEPEVPWMMACFAAALGDSPTAPIEEELLGGGGERHGH